MPARLPAGRVRARHLRHFHCLLVALPLAVSVYGCASAAPPPEPALQAAFAAPPPLAVVPDPPLPGPVDAMLGFADRVRNLAPPELSQEISALGDPQDSPQRQVQLAIALSATRTTANGGRAQALLQRVLGQNNAQAQALHPLARMLLAQQAESRRVEEQLERQTQLAKDAQRRIDQLSDRLEALRAVERSLVVRPGAAVSAPVQRP